MAWDSDQNFQRCQYLWVVLGVSGLQGDELQIQRTAQIHRGDNVPAQEAKQEVKVNPCPVSETRHSHDSLDACVQDEFKGTFCYHHHQGAAFHLWAPPRCSVTAVISSLPAVLRTLPS